MALTKLQSNGLAVGAVTAESLSDTGVTANTYGGQTAIPVITIDAKGRVTLAANSSITAGATLQNDTTTDSDDFFPVLSNATTGSFVSGFTSNTNLYFNPSTGTLNVTVSNTLSDETKKKNITNINNPFLVLNQIHGVEFEWAANDQKSAGVIAQNVEAVLPHLVTTNKFGIKSVNYDGLIAYLIEAVKTLGTELEELKKNDTQSPR
jgi:hypothetical protein